MKKYFLMLLIATALALMPSVAYPADVKVTALPAATSVTNDDLLMVVDSPSGTPTSKKITLDNFFTSGGTLAQGDTFYWDTTGKALTIGSAGKLLRSSGTLPAWSSSTFADTYLKGSILYNATANTVSGLAHPGAANYIMYSSGTDTIGWLPSSTNMITLLGSATYETARESLGVKIGTDVQAYNANAVEGPTTPSAGYLTKWDSTGHKIVDGLKLGNTTDGKWCSYTTADGLKCTESAPEGAGDITAVADCTTGACYSGGASAGTYIRLYDGNSHYTGIAAGDSSANLTFTLPTAYPAGTYLMTVGTGGALAYVNPTAYQAADADLTTYAGITPSENIQTFLGSATYEAARENLGVKIGTDVQAYNSNLTAINQALTTTSSPTFAGLSLMTSASAGGSATLLEGSDNGTNFRKISVPAALSNSLELRYPNTVPTDSQVLVFSSPSDGISEGVWTDTVADAELKAIAGLTSAANAIPYFTGSGTADVISSSSDIITFLGSEDSAAALEALGSWGISGEITDEQLICAETTDGGNLLKSCGVKTVYTEPASNVPLCRTGSATTGGCSNLTDVAMVHVDGSVPMTGALVPNVANTIALGSASAEWADIYLGDGGVIYGQNDSSNTITSSATGWTFAKPIAVADVTNDNYIQITNNASREATASVNQLYPEGNVWKLSENGTEYSRVAAPTAGPITMSGSTAARTWTIPDAAVTIPANPIGGTLGATANVIPKASGTGTATLQASGITEDGTNVDLGALNLITTGAIHGGIEIIADDTSISAAQCYGSFNDTNGTETITLPTAVVGMNLVIYSNDATVKTVDPYSSEVIELNGTALTGGYAIKSPGAAGNFVALICRTTGVWTTLGMGGAWVTNGS